MSRTKIIPDDVRQICIYLVRGYDRRTRLYFEKKKAAQNSPRELIALEALPETKRMRAVEEAKRGIGLDLPEVMRAKLVDAIVLNCKSGRRYPYEYLDVEGIGRTDFYQRRNHFLADIARFLGMA